MTVGRKLANPYTVDNMNKALRNIIAASQKRSNDPLNPGFKVELSLQQIKATHYHVKFSPRTWEELELLEADSILDLSNYPLDHEVVGSGMIYRDADDESFEDLYTAWPAEKAFPATVPYEIIDTLFIPEDETTAKRLGITENFTERLLDEAYRLTGNAEEHDKGTAASRWYPSGTLKVWDDAVNGYIPLIGARVRISKGWRYYYTDTDQFGQFRARSSFSGKVVYKILWQGSKWNIRDGTSGRAYYKSSKMNGPFNLLIGSHGRQCRFATIHRAAFRHFHLNNGLLYRADASHKVKIAYINKYNKKPGQFIGWGAWNLFGIFRDIRIWGAVNGKGWRTTQQIFNTTSHELGHCAMFYNLGRSDYNKKDEIIIESWGKFMGWLMSDIEYEQLGYYGILHKYVYINVPPVYYRFEVEDGYNLQYWNSDNLISKHDRKYTPLFIDLYDDSNQHYIISILIIQTL